MANITALYAGLCGILVIALALRVVRFRFKKKVGLGAGEDLDDQLRVRVHANAVENIPLALLLLLLAELGGLAAGWLHLLGGLFLLARLMHAYGLTASGGGYHFGRFAGTALSWSIVLVLAVINISFALLN